VPENCPLSVLEAFASARPVIATEVGGVPELFEDRTGIIVPPNDPEALASAMRQFWDAPDRCCDYGVRARRRAETHHDIAAYVNDLEEIYESLKGADPNQPVSMKKTLGESKHERIRQLQTFPAEQRRGA
jgi:glycosyltransferase involved in cell wall biosynthesis